MDHATIRKAGLKVTLPRVKVLEMLGSAKARHLTAEEVYRLLLAKGEDISLATVYRVLTQFVDVGLAERHRFEEGQAVFELNRGDHHDHIICQQCGRVEEFFDATIEQHQQSVAEQKGFVVEDHALIIYGRCTKPACPHLT
ncbi:MAG: ferric iron uptake transcriptional regulator [Pseudomonadota bacterium]